MKPIPKCPYCKRDLIKMVNLSPLEPEQYYCPKCGRTWYEHDIDYRFYEPEDFLSDEIKRLLHSPGKLILPGDSDDVDMD